MTQDIRDKKIMSKMKLLAPEEIFSPEDDRDFHQEDVMKATLILPEEYLAPQTPILNQGTVGSCVAHALATCLAQGQKAIFETSDNFSRGFIYANRGEKDWKGPGMVSREALKQLNKCGDVLYKDFPYNKEYPGITAKFDGDENLKTLLRKAAPYAILNYFRCYTPEEIKTTIVNYGAVFIAVDIYDGFGRNVELPKQGEKSHGGHAMTIVGWTKDNKWIVQNSWGKLWGDRGKCYMPFDYPIKESWGITINQHVKPEKHYSWYVRIWNWIKSLFKKIKNNKKESN